MLEMHVGGHILRALKHHVLEQMCETRFALVLVLRSHMIPEIHGDKGNGAILVQDDVQAIRQIKFFKRQVDRGTYRLCILNGSASNVPCAGIIPRPDDATRVSSIAWPRPREAAHAFDAGHQLLTFQYTLLRIEASQSLYRRFVLYMRARPTML